MNISYNWLKQYIDIDLPAEEVGKILTSIGLEVEGIETFETIKGGLEGFVVGEVKTCAKHPNADKLSVTTVDIGQPNLLPIVCGAPNVAAGQKVIVATVGTTIYKGDENFKIQKAKLRGEPSEGMICAEDELGIGTDHSGILVLDPAVKTGTPAKELFNVVSDKIFVIGLTPNRIDAASHYGVARELAAYMSLKKPVALKKPTTENFKQDNSSRVIDIIVENKEACPRYSGLTISGVEVKPSPEWLQNRLKSIGQNPINNVVDITNFILHELGQPLHAFDADKITGDKVIVKTLPEGTKFSTLDNNERTLSASDLMICNTKEGMCIAGVFGGIESGVTEQTKNIFLESACFSPKFVRQTSKRHQLNTDASFRFERGTDPNMPVLALKRAAMLIKELAGGNISSSVIDVYPSPIADFDVDLKYDYADMLIGKKIERDTIKKILTQIDIKIEKEELDGLKLKVAPYRVDVQRPADVVEEILRIYGYNNVEFSETVHSTLSYSEKPDRTEVVNKISDWLSSNGFNEMMANSLTKSAYYDGLESYKPENLVYLMNPLSQDLNCMRQTLLFGGLESVLHNHNRKNQDLKLYEFGNTYKKEPENKNQPLAGYTEEMHLALYITGLKKQANWISKEEPSNFYFIKSFAENILKRVGITIEKLTISEFSNDIFSEGLHYQASKNTILSLGIVNRKILQLADIKTPVYYADFNWDRVMELIKNNKIVFEDLPRFPEVKRDLSMVLGKEIKFEQLRELALKTEKNLLKRINLFDVYEGDKIEKGKKSYAVSFYLQDIEKTLTDENIDKIMQKLTQAFEKELGAHIRA
jgi:phenylalanyl-tRNA synthetase beta chain